MTSVLAFAVLSFVAVAGVRNILAISPEWEYLGDFTCDSINNANAVILPSYQECLDGCVDQSKEYIYVNYDIREGFVGGCSCHAYNNCDKIAQEGIQLYKWKGSGNK